MPVTEIQRTELINRLVEVLGEERTETLMQCILPEGRDQLATKSDLGVLKSDLGVLKSDLGVLKSDLKALETNLRAEFTEHKAETKAGFTELRAYIDSTLAKHHRQYTFMLVGFVVSNWAAMIPLILAT